MKHILVIDNDINTLTVIQLILSSYGYKVESHSNWKEGMNEIINKKPSLIILKVNLGNVDGRNLISQLKYNSDTKDIPVILISSNNESTISLEETGAQDFITTPVTFNSIIQKIKNVIGMIII